MQDKLYAKVPAGTRSRPVKKDFEAAIARKKIEELKEQRKIFNDLNLNFDDYFVKGDF